MRALPSCGVWRRAERSSSHGEWGRLRNRRRRGGFRKLKTRQLAQSPAEIQMMPELRGDHAAKPKACERAELSFPLRQGLAVAPDRAGVEIAGARERLRADQIAHEAWRVGEEAFGEWRAEHGLARRGDLRRQDAGGGLPQQIFILGEAMQLPARMNARSKRDHVFIEKRVAGLDAVGHGHAIALLRHQQPGEEHLVAEIERAVQRMPAAQAWQVERQILIGDKIAEPLFEALAV